MTEPAGGFLKKFRELIRRSLAARLATIATVSVIGLVAVGVIAYTQFNRQMLRILIDPEIGTVMDNLIGNAGPGLSGEIALRDLPYDPRYLQALSGRYYQIARLNDDGTVLVQVISPSLFDAGIELDPKLLAQITAPTAATAPHFYTIPGPDSDEPLRIIARVAEIPELEGRYLFIVGVAPRSILAPAANLVGLAFAVFVAFCAMMVAAVTLLQIRIGLEPLSQLRRDIANVRRGDAERLSGEYPAELQPVAVELNALVDHNREVVERARRHVGNLAHALKTPLSVLVNETSNVQGPLGEKVREQLGVMRDQVQRHLERARIAARVAVVSTTVEVAPVVEVLVRTMEKIHRDRGVALQSKTNPEIRFRGERQDIEEMVGNLVDNACKWAATRVNIEMFALSAPLAGRPASFRIQVDDDGPGLAPAEREEVLHRGKRLDESKPGTGLGLSIVLELAKLYGGTLQLGSSPLGGLRAELVLPAA